MRTWARARERDKKSVVSSKTLEKWADKIKIRGRDRLSGKASWKKIATEYITGHISVAKLAEKYKMSEATIRARSKSESWGKKRKEHRENVIKKTADKIAESTAEKLKKEYDIACSMGAALERALSDEQQFFRHTDIYGKEHIGNAIDAKRLSDAAKALKDLTEIKKLAGGLLTEFEERKLKLEEKKIAASGKEKENDGLGGVIIMPEIISEEENEDAKCDMEAPE